MWTANCSYINRSSYLKMREIYIGFCPQKKVHPPNHQIRPNTAKNWSIKWLSNQLFNGHSDVYLSRNQCCRSVWHEFSFSHFFLSFLFFSRPCIRLKKEMPKTKELLFRHEHWRGFDSPNVDRISNVVKFNWWKERERGKASSGFFQST